MSDHSPKNYEPNPNPPKPSLLEILKALLVLPCIPWQFLSAVVRTVRQPHNEERVSFLMNFILGIMRGSGPLVSLSIIRSFSENTDSNLGSKRFSPYQKSLYQRVSRDDWSGNWICKGPPGKEVDPASCDLVVYYIHGGAYAMGSTGQSLLTHLRIAELAAEQGIMVSFFSLDYSWCPEAIYPTQETQAVSAYKYLLQEGIKSSHIAAMGDSAGGHLILTLLTKLHELHLPKPEGGIFLLAPWIDLLCSRDGSFVRNRNKDFIVREDLITHAKGLIGDGPLKDRPEIIDFSLPRPGGVTWAQIMPKRVWISVGSHEVFLDDNVRFVERLKADGVDVEFEVEPGKAHVWQGIEDTFSRSKYLATAVDGVLADGMMKGSKNIATALLAGKV